MLEDCLRCTKGEGAITEDPNCTEGLLEVRADLNTAKGDTPGDDVMNATRHGFGAVSESDSFIQKVCRGFDNLTRSPTLGPVFVLVGLKRPFTVKFVRPKTPSTDSLVKLKRLPASSPYSRSRCTTCTPTHVGPSFRLKPLSERYFFSLFRM